MGFQYFPYHQLRMENELFTGWVAINELTDGADIYWDFPKAGQAAVAGKGMRWLTLIPDGQSRSITAKFLPDGRVSVWYVDVIDEVRIDDDGVVAFMDKYLDVKFTPSGDVMVEDRDELDAAFRAGELTRVQYEQALTEGESILRELCADISATEKWCRDILNLAEERIRQHPFTIFLDIDGVLDIFQPHQSIQTLLPEAVARLANLVHRTNARVVVISDWRYGSWDCEKSNDMLLANWKQLEETLTRQDVPIADVTTCEALYARRTDEVRAYLAEHPEIEKYAILDDCFHDDYASDAEIKRHLIHVNARQGLRDEDCMQACRLMNEII